MRHIYKVTEWQGGSGLWYCNDTTDGHPQKWWVAARALNLDIESYLQLLVDKFHVTHMAYNKPTDCLVFYWDNYKDCHAYVLYVNRIARNNKFMV